MAYRWLFYKWTNSVINTKSVKRFVKVKPKGKKFYVWYILLRQKEVQLTDGCSMNRQISDEYRKSKKKFVTNKREFYT